MGREVVPETSENLYILTLLSARENFIDNNLFLVKYAIFNTILLILFTNLVTYYWFNFPIKKKNKLKSWVFN